MRRLLPVLVACLACGTAVAQPAAPPRPPTDLSGVTVTPSAEHPKVVATYPVAGQAVAPGVLVISVTFDQPMLNGAFDIASAPGAAALDCLKTPRLLDDRKTFVLLCTAHSGKAYTLAFNGTPVSAEGGGFVNLGRRRAEPATLAFTASTGEPLPGVAEALKAAKLKPSDMPVMEQP